MERRLAGGRKDDIGIGAVRCQPFRAGEVTAKAQDRVEWRGSISGPRMIRLRTEFAEQLERRGVTGARGQGERHAVVGAGAELQQRACEGKRTGHPGGTPEHGTPHAVVQPGEPGIRVGAELDQAPSDCGK